MTNAFTFAKMLSPSLMGTDGYLKVTFHFHIATCWNNDSLFTERKFPSTQILIQAWNNISRAGYAINRSAKHISKQFHG